MTILSTKTRAMTDPLISVEFGLKRFHLLQIIADIFLIGDKRLLIWKSKGKRGGGRQKKGEGEKVEGEMRDQTNKGHYSFRKFA